MDEVEDGEWIVRSARERQQRGQRQHVAQEIQSRGALGRVATPEQPDVHHKIDQGERAANSQQRPDRQRLAQDARREQDGDDLTRDRAPPQPDDPAQVDARS